MSLQELFQAMNMFKDGVQQMSVARGISAAQQQVEELKNTEMDEMEKRAAATQISNQLAQNLYKTGAPVAQIQGVVGAFAPPAIKDAEDALVQGTSSGSLADLATGMQQFKLQPDIKKIDREGFWKMEAARLQGSVASGRDAVKQDDKSNERILKQLQQFETRGDVKGLRTNLDAVSKLDTLLSDGSATGQQLSKLSLIRLAQGSGVVTDRDAAKAEGDPSYAATLMRNMSLKFVGQPWKEDAELYKRLATSLTSAAHGRLKEKAQAFAKQRSRYLNGVTPETFSQSVIDGIEAPNAPLPGDTPVSPTGNTPPKFDLNKYIKPSGSSTQRGRGDVASASFNQGLEPSSTPIQRPNEQGDPYIDRLIQNQNDLRDARKRVPYTRKA